MNTNSKWLLSTVKVLLNVAWYGNIALMIFAFCVLTVKFTSSDFSEFSAPVKYPLNSPEIIPLESLTPYADKITIQPDQALLKMELKNTAGQMFTAYIFLITFEILAMTIIYQLRKFFGALKQDTPFQYHNIRRLRITALCFALLTPLHMLLGLSTWTILNGQVKSFDTMHMVWSESFIGLALGAVIYIMADVFKYGFELQKENGEFV